MTETTSLGADPALSEVLPERRVSRWIRLVRQSWFVGSDLLPLVGYIAAAMLMSYPLVLHLWDQQLAARDIDAWMKVWDNWWFERVILDGQRAYFTPDLFYPHGGDLRFHSISWVLTAVWWPLSGLFGRIGAYNLLTVLTTISCGFFAYLLIRHIVQNRAAAWLGGLVFAFIPIRHGAGGSWPDYANLQWIPLIVWMLLLGVEQKRLRFAVLAGLLMGVATWTSLYVMNIAAITLLVVMLALALTSQRWRDPAFIRLAAVFGITSLLLIAPRLIPIFSDLQALDTALEKSPPETTQTDVVALVTPSLFHGAFYRIPGWSEHVRKFPQNYKWSGYLGMVALGLSALGLWAGKRRLGLWAALAGVFLLLTLGPILRFNGEAYPSVWMPARLVFWLPFIRGSRPAVFELGIALPLSVLTGAGAALLLERVSARQITRSGVLMGLTLVMLFEYWNGRVPIRETAVPDFYYEIAADRDSFALIDLPMGRQASKQYMFYQTIHQHPIVEGSPGRTVPSDYNYVEANPLLLRWRQHLPLDCAALDYQANLQALADDGFRYVVVHRSEQDGSLPEYAPSYFASTDPYFEGAAITVYRTEDLLHAGSCPVR